MMKDNAVNKRYIVDETILPEAILKTAEQRLPLYVAARETEEENERLMQLGAQGVYVAI